MRVRMVVDVMVPCWGMNGSSSWWVGVGVRWRRAPYIHSTYWTVIQHTIRPRWAWYRQRDVPSRGVTEAILAVCTARYSLVCQGIFALIVHLRWCSWPWQTSPVPTSAFTRFTRLDVGFFTWIWRVEVSNSTGCPKSENESIFLYLKFTKTIFPWGICKRAYKMVSITE